MSDPEHSTPDAGGDRPPHTGDGAVDEALGRFGEATGDDLDDHVRAGEEVHRALRERLADLGGE